MPPPDERRPSPASLGFLAEGGEMGERTRTFDWSQTALGPPEGWPQSLKIAVRIMLGSRYAMWIGWGPDFLFFYNDAYGRMTLGAKHPWALGRPACEVWPEIWEELRPRAESVVQTGQATWDERLLLFLERRGFPEETYHTFSYSPLPDDADGVGGMLCVVTEDTERTIGERRLRTLRELASRTTEAAKSPEDACRTAARTMSENPHDLPFALIYLLDADAKSVRLTGAAGLADGTAAAPPRTSLAAHDADGGWPFRAVLDSGRTQLVTDLRKRFGDLPGGAWPDAPQQAAVLPLAKPGQTRPAGFVVLGVSPRLAFDDAYEGFFDLAAGHVTAAIANARAYEEERRRAEALAELDRAKTDFFSNVSHEFRTPLTLMLGPVERLLSLPESELPTAAKAELAVVERNSLRLLRLVNSLLDFSRIEAGRVQAVFQPTDLAAFTTDLASVFRSACEGAGLKLVIDCPPLPEPVFVDREMWEKIVFNLLSNAFKFTFEGEIVVSLRPVGRFAELRVRDTGTGVPPEEAPRLFERFHRVRNARGRTHEGSGIGLALVQELVKLHRGSIVAESVLGKGTTFATAVPLGSGHLPADQLGADSGRRSSVTAAAPFVEEALRWLPDHAPSPQADPKSPLEDAAANAESDSLVESREGDSRPRVLVADDNADMRRYVVRLLSGGHRVEAVADGEAAFAAAQARRPDLILTDVMMPRLDGFGLLRKLRADPATRNVPVVMLSARAGEESRVEGMVAGADDYLVKPFSAKELLARVGAHLQMARMRREADEALRESHARFEALFDAAPIGIYLVDADLRIRHVNPKAIPVFGEIEGLIGRDFVEVLHILWPKAYADEILERFRHTLATGEPHLVAETSEERLDRKTVEYYEWQVSRIGLPDGRFGVVCYFSDVSRHVKARRKLAEADRRKDEFLAVLAHELRNPLAPIRNGLQLMKLAERDPATVELARTMMERQLAQMVRLIDDLLDMSRISRGKVMLRKSRVLLASVLRNAVETSRPLIEASGHVLEFTIPPSEIFVDADEMRLSQVFANLLNNAAKYTESRGRIRLSVVCDGDEAVVAVADSGVGIPPPMLPKVFEMFTQVDRSLEKSQGGLGIGLTIAKRLVEMHGGAIEARSEGHGKGSEFVVRLPTAAPCVEAPSESGVGRGAVQRPRRRILVVDDNRDSAISLALMLKVMGNDVRTAHDGLEALDAAAAFRPQVVLLDIGMPKLNGYETARRIRQSPWGAGMVLVAQTGWGQDEDKRLSQEAGFDLHLVKPVDPASIEKILAGFPAEAV